MKNLKLITNGQKDYFRSILENKITFCIGPAGTGKTYISTRYAANKFANNEYERIVICRPFVTAGEDIGFLPGDLNEKTDPFTRPIYDELGVFFSPQQILTYIHNRAIEVVPFGFLRGRTFHKSIILVDESQNCTYEQLKLILTRFGQGSKMIINGDVTQSDLLPEHRGALFTYSNILKGVNGIGVVYLDKCDIQREKIVEDILNRLEQNQNAICSIPS